MIFLDRQLQHENQNYWSLLYTWKCAKLWKTFHSWKMRYIMEKLDSWKRSYNMKMKSTGDCKSWKMRNIMEKVPFLENALYYWKSANPGNWAILWKKCYSWKRNYNIKMTSTGGRKSCKMRYIIEKCHSWNMRNNMENLLFLENALN